MRLSWLVGLMLAFAAVLPMLVPWLKTPVLLALSNGLAVLGVTAYRAAFEDPRARVGPQVRTIGGTRVWVLPERS